MQAAPEFLRIFKNPILCTNLNIADHFSGKMLVYQRANGRTGPAVETFQGCIFAVTFHLFGKVGMN
jgi:hypothetical protein